MDMTSYTDKIKKFLKIQNYHAAVNIAISGLNECRRNDDQCGVDKFVSIIKGIAQTMAHEFGSLEKNKKALLMSCVVSILIPLIYISYKVFTAEGSSVASSFALMI